MRPAAGTERSQQPAVGSQRAAAHAFPAAVAGYLVLMLGLARYYTYNLYPDSTSYLSIAQAYARGQFWDAINGYWSPLYCWLLAPLIAAGIDVLIAPKLLALVVAVLTLVGVRRLARRLALSDRSIAALTIGAVLPLVSWSLTYITPDFLLVAVLTWYFSEVVAWSPDCGARAGLAAGALAGLAYLSKQYALPFVVVHLALAGALHYHQHRGRASRATVHRWLLAAYLVLFAVAGPWVAIMSAKYGRLTIAASGTYNWYLLSTGFNVGTRTLASPAFPGAVSAWVDPTPYAHTAPSRVRPPDPTADAPRGFLQEAKARLERTIVMLELFSFLALAILGAAAFLAVREVRRRADYRYAQLGLALAVYIGGYQIVTAWYVERLMWIVAVLLGLLGALVFERVKAWRPFGPAVRLTAAALLVVSFWVLPLLRLVQGRHGGRDLYATAQRLAQAGVQGRIASLNRYADSLQVAFFTGSSYYGRIVPPPAIEPVLEELQSNRIDFLLVWSYGDGESRSAGLQRELAGRFPDVTRGAIPELAVLDLRSR